MIVWLQSIDASLFHFVNSSLSNPLFDKLMPWASDSPFFMRLVLLVAFFLVWKGGARGRICVLMLGLSLCLGNWLVVDSLKNGVARLRPFQVLPEVILRVGKGGSFAMPSSHAANCFAAAMGFWVYYRRSAWITLPLALLVSFSRVYNGVHYLGDVLAGAFLGAGYSAAVIWLGDAFWQSLGPRWFPLWKAQLPSLIRPAANPAPPADAAGRAARDAQWLHLGYLLAAFLLLIRLAYLASGKIELSEDEAYQWLWSKHPALSYYSKPPLIAYMQFLGTHIWGDNEFGVRFFSPVITAIMTVLLLRFMARQTSGRAAFILLLLLCASPLLALGSVVMTVDPLSVLFWTAALIAGWRACAPAGATRDWLWTGLWMGLGFLSKYTNLFQFVCWAVFFLLWAPARAHLRKPGPWLALLVVALCSLPVMVWNSQHHWITVAHVASDGQLGEKTHRAHVGEFLLGEAGLVNPVFFVGALWAAIGFWREGRRGPCQLFLFSMGMPLFLMFLLLSIHTRIEFNWIAPAIVPMFCLMAVFWSARWRQHTAVLKPFLSFGVGAGLFAVVMAHDTQLLGKLLHRALPPRLDPLHRVHGWKETARIAGQARAQIAAPDKPAFIICEHYGMTSQISFYLPEAKSRATTGDPLVYYRATPKPENQFYFWPNYLDHTGQNAIFIRELERPRLRPGWFTRWWRQSGDLYLDNVSPSPVPPPDIQREFESVTNLGVTDVIAGGNLVRRIQLFACRNLRPQ
jgi:4-amino-4-deoxy-L-arabinose transferase-like glycosyltransferase/membrane-associated phospholipid phosphatase